MMDEDNNDPQKEDPVASTKDSQGEEDPMQRESAATKEKQSEGLLEEPKAEGHGEDDPDQKRKRSTAEEEGDIADAQAKKQKVEEEVEKVEDKESEKPKETASPTVTSEPVESAESVTEKAAAMPEDNEPKIASAGEEDKPTAKEVGIQEGTSSLNSKEDDNVAPEATNLQEDKMASKESIGGAEAKASEDSLSLPNDNKSMKGKTEAAATGAGAAPKESDGVTTVKTMVANLKGKSDEDPTLIDGWYNWLDDLLAYHAKHGHCQVRDAENHILYSWLKRQRIMFRKGKLEPDKLRILQLLKTNGFDVPSSSAKTPGSSSSRSRQGSANKQDTAGTSAGKAKGKGKVSRRGSSPVPLVSSYNVAPIDAVAAATMSQGLQLPYAGLAGSKVDGNPIGQFAPGTSIPVPPSADARQPMNNKNPFIYTYPSAGAPNSRQRRGDAPGRVAGSINENPLSGAEPLPSDQMDRSLNAMTANRQQGGGNEQPGNLEQQNQAILLLLRRQEQQRLQEQQLLLEQLIRRQFQQGRNDGDNNNPN